MRLFRSRKKWSAAILGAAAIGTFAAVALGSMAFDFTATTLVTGNLVDRVDVSHDGIKLQTNRHSLVRVQKVVIGPGGYSGWHHHPGIVIVTVESGAVTFTQADCSSKTYGPGLPAGAVFVEASDSPGQASSVGGATLYATFVVPQTNPAVFRVEDDPPPHCR